MKEKKDGESGGAETEKRVVCLQENKRILVRLRENKIYYKRSSFGSNYTIIVPE